MTSQEQLEIWKARAEALKNRTREENLAVTSSYIDRINHYRKLHGATTHNINATTKEAQ